MGPASEWCSSSVDELYDREGLYGVGGQDHPGQCSSVRASVAGGPRVGGPISRHPRRSCMRTTGRPVWCRSCCALAMRQTQPGGASPRSSTIHNLAYQGVFPPDTLTAVDLRPELYTIDGLEFWGQISFLKGGINFADAVTTVSAAYARQILTPEYGEGLEGLLTYRQQILKGILNGIDTETWDPRTDPYLPAPFSASNLAGKRSAKREVLRRFGLPVDRAAMARPVVGMVSRMVDQKGLDLIREARDALTGMDAAFIILGTGERRYEEMWLALAASHPTRIGARIGFDEELAHLIEGGRRPVSDALALRAVWTQPDVQYAIRYGAGGAGYGWPRGHRATLQSGHGDRHRVHISRVHGGGPGGRA